MLSFLYQSQLTIFLIDMVNVVYVLETKKAFRSNNTESFHSFVSLIWVRTRDLWIVYPARLVQSKKVLFLRLLFSFKKYPSRIDSREDHDRPEQSAKQDPKNTAF